jgi:hypothetical protein
MFEIFEHFDFFFVFSFKCSNCIILISKKQFLLNKKSYCTLVQNQWMKLLSPSHLVTPIQYTIFFSKFSKYNDSCTTINLSMLYIILYKSLKRNVFNLLGCTVCTPVLKTCLLWILYNYCTWTRSIWGYMEQSTTIFLQ